MTTAKTLIFSALVAAAGAVSAQGNQSWTATDMYGNTHSIADYLAQGKTVLVDISAHWCGPCWGWHNSGIMEKAYEEYGPDGTGDLIVIFLDGDPGSTVALLEGASGSQGDWTAGTPYPIIGPNGEGQAVASNYSFTGYPTLYMHCPGNSAGTVISREATFEQFMSSWYGDCPTAFDNGSDDATLYGVHGEVKLCPGDVPSVEIVNAGTTNLTSATVTMKNSSGVVIETQQWSGNLATFDTDMVDFTTGVSGWAEMTFEVSNPNGTFDQNQFGNEQVIAFGGAEPTATSLTLDIMTDNYGSETGWKLYDGSGTVIDQVAAGTYPDSNPQLNSYNWTVNAGDCYKFEITDAYGDGMCCTYGNGYYRISETGTSNIFIEGGEFGGIEDAPFVPSATVGVNDLAAGNDLNIFPNPSTGLVNVQFDMDNSELVSIEVYNILGEIVMNRSENVSAGIQNEVFNMSALNNGVYYFNIKAGNLNTTKKVTINK